MPRPVGPRLSACRRGSVAVEFAILAPLLLAIVAAGIFYSRWFAAASETQNLASEGARAAVAGLDDAERQAIVAELMTARATPLERGATRTWSAAREGDLYSVSVTTTLPDYELSRLIPMPTNAITRQAFVVVGDAG